MQKNSHRNTKKKEQNLKLPLSNFEQLHKEFSRLIFDLRDGDGEFSSSRDWARKTFIFHDQTRLIVKERIKEGKIAWYYYDYVDQDSMTIIKFHSESHDDRSKSSKKYQTETEPFHIHGTEIEKLSNIDRYANFEHRSLRQVLEAIFLHKIMQKSEDTLRKKKT